MFRAIEDFPVRWPEGIDENGDSESHQIKEPPRLGEYDNGGMVKLHYDLLHRQLSGSGFVSGAAVFL